MSTCRVLIPLVAVCCLLDLSIDHKASFAHSNDLPTPGFSADISHGKAKSGGGKAVEMIRIRCSGDAFRGWPRLKVMVDGRPVGDPITVKASHADGHWQDIILKPPADQERQAVSIVFMEDAWGGSAVKDRNLYIDRVEINGMELDPDSAMYQRFDGRRFTTTGKMSWAGALTFDIRGLDPESGRKGMASGGGSPVNTVNVSTEGRDEWSGRLWKPNADLSDGPLATLEKARDLARASDGVDTIVVRRGDYYLDRTVEFDARDKDLVIKAAVGEVPTFHGGVPVTDWTKGADGGWSAPLTLPEGMGVGDLFVKGEKQIEARYPNLPPGGGVRDGWLFAAAPNPSLGEWQGNLHFRFHDGDLPPLGGTAGLTAHIVGGFNPWSQWGSDTLPVVSIDYASNTVHTRGTSYFFTGEGSRYFLTGTRDLLDAPGEWWYDGTGNRLHYIPADPSFDGSAVLAGTLPTLFRLNDADGMVLSGLEFRHGAPQGSGKYGTENRGFGAVRLEHADHVKILGNMFENLGVGIHVSESDDVVIAGNDIGHTAGNGIYVGTVYGSFGRSDRAEIVGNHIHDVSEVYFETAGLWFQSASNLRAAHNLIENASQFGIAGGSLWGPQDATYGNVIEYNIVRNANQQTADGGAIKIMGEQADRQDTVIRYNLVTGTDQLMNKADGTFWPSGYENIHEWPTPISWAIYTDGKASGIRIEGNLVLKNVSGIGINGGWNNVVTGNIIANGTGTAFRVDDATGRSWHPDWAQANRFESNIVAIDHQGSRAAYIYAPGHGAGYVNFSKNLYSGMLDGKSFDTWPRIMKSGDYGGFADFQNAGQDAGSVIADPLFRDPQAGDFSLKDGSIAYELGFKDIPVGLMGPAGFDACAYGLC